MIIVAAAKCSPDLPDPANGNVTVTNGGYYPSTAIYTCNTSYVLTDSSLATNQCKPGTEDPTKAYWNEQAPPACTGASPITLYTWCMNRLNESMIS